MTGKSPAFRAAAKKPPATSIKTYVFDYESETAAFFDAYRQSFNKAADLKFVDASDLSNIKIFAEYPDDNRKKLTEAFLRNHSFFITTAEQTHREYRGVTAHIYDSLTVMLSTPVDKIGQSFLGHAISPDVADAFIFDHEIGHAICRDAFVGTYSNLKESIADAFATLRHYQRFGVQSTALDHLPAMRAVGLVFRPDSGDHFTSPVVQHIIEDRKNIDFTALTLAETTQMARRYAALYAPHPKSVENLAKKFQHFNNKLSPFTKGEFAVLRHLAATVLAAEDPEEFKWGSRAVCAILDGKVGFEQKRILPIGEEWMQIRQALNKREAELEQSGILFGIQQTNPTTQNNKRQYKPT
jgi:hypothetical protein